MGNASPSSNSIELRKSHKQTKSFKDNVDTINHYRQRHRFSINNSKDTRLLRAQYFNKLSIAKELEKHSFKNTNSLLTQFTDDLPEMNHPFADKEVPLKCI